MSNKPEQVFKVGPVRASVFQNEIEHKGQKVNLPKVVLEVRYKDKEGNWKGTNSLSVNELPKAILALEKAYDYLTTQRERSETRPDTSSPSAVPPGE